MTVSNMSADDVNKTMGGQIVPTKAAALALSSRAGFEDTAAEAGDLMIPRLKVIHGQSKEMGNPALTIRPGDIFETVSQTTVAKEGAFLRFVPIFSWKHWEKRIGEGQDMHAEWQSRDPRDPRVIEGNVWGKSPDGKPIRPEVTEVRNFLVLTAEATLPAVIAFSGTKAGIGKALYTAMFAKGGSMFDHAYEIATKRVEDPRGPYHTFVWKHAGPATEIERATAGEFYAQFSGIKDAIRGEAE